MIISFPAQDPPRMVRLPDKSFVYGWLTPDGVVPSLIRLSDGREAVLISAVAP